MGQNTKKVGTTFAIVSGISYGFYGIFSTILLQAGLTSMAIVALPVLALTVFFGVKTMFKPHVLRKIPWKIIILLVLLGVTSNAMNFSYIQAYTQGMPVGVVSIVAFCNVIVVMILSAFIFKYRFTPAKVISIVLALLGVSLVIGIFGGKAGGVYTMMGVFWTCLIPIFYGINVIMNTYALVKGADADAVLFISQGTALILVLILFIHPVALVQNIFGSLGSNALYWVAFLGFCLIPHALCYGAMQEALKRIDPTIYQILMSLDPVTALTLGIIIMSQAVSGLQIVGVAIVLAAVIFITVMDGREAKAESAMEEETPLEQGS